MDGAPGAVGHAQDPGGVRRPLGAHQDLQLQGEVLQVYVESSS